jgi:hypothetical protein
MVLRAPPRGDESVDGLDVRRRRLYVADELDKGAEIRPSSSEVAVRRRSELEGWGDSPAYVGGVAGVRWLGVQRRRRSTSRRNGGAIWRRRRIAAEQRCGGDGDELPDVRRCSWARGRSRTQQNEESRRRRAAVTGRGRRRAAEELKQNKNKTIK